LKEVGLNYRYARDVERKSIFSCDSDVNGDRKNENVDPVKVTDVFTAFLVVVCGLMASLLLLLFEISKKKYFTKLERMYYI
jgi:hypothetical protein